MKFACPRCTEKFETDDTQAGHSFDCTTCHYRFVIPTPIQQRPKVSSVKIGTTEAKKPSVWLEKIRKIVHRLAVKVAGQKKRIAYGIIAPVLVVILLACIVFYVTRRKPELPAQVTKNYMESIANGDYARAKQYVTESSLHLLADQELKSKKYGEITYPSYKCNVQSTERYDKQILVVFNSLDSSANKEDSLLLTNIAGDWKIDLQGMVDANLKRAKEIAQDMAIIKEHDNGISIAVACSIYADENGGVFPPDLKTALARLNKDESVLVSPLATNSDQPSYEYFGGRKSDPPKQIVFQSRFTTPEGRLVGYVDGTTDWKKDSD